jgi:hypothetical protein
MDWTEKDQKLYDDIVHQLRSQGWSREDAMEEADIKTAERIERRNQQEPGDSRSPAC